MSSGGCFLLTMRRCNILQANSSLFIPVQKLFGISGIHAHLVHFRSPPFKGSLYVRPGDLCTYVLTPYGRTPIDPLNVRPYNPWSYDHKNPTKMTDEKATTNRWSSECRSQDCLDYAESQQRSTTVNINIHGGNNQILPSATHA